MAADTINPIICGEQPFSISFSPTHDKLATGLINGNVEIHSYNESSTSSSSSHPTTIQPYTNSPTPVSCRSVIYRPDGSLLYGGLSNSNKGELCGIDTTTGAVSFHNKQASDQGVNKVYTIERGGGELLASGDDGGAVKLWDSRMSSKSDCLAAYEVNQDYISDFVSSSDGNTLLATSGDATLSVFDVRKISSNVNSGNAKMKTTQSRSDDQEDELLSCVIIKGGKKVICGTQEGALTIWSWGDWGDQNDRFMGHPESIDALLKLDEGTIITGSSDGLVRVVEIQPNRLLGVLGDHDGFPVEDLQFSRDRGLIGSLSHDDIVRMWDVSILHEEEGSDEDEEEMDIDVNGIMAAGGLNESENENENEGSDDDWSDMDDEGEEEEEEEKGGKKKRKESIDSDDSGGDDSGGDDSDDEDDEGDEDYGRGRKKFKTESEKFFVDL